MSTPPLIRKTKIVPLTDKSFTPFGEVLGTVSRAPDRISIGGTLSTWFSSFAVDGEPRVAFARYDFAMAPTDYRLRHLEHHRGITQAVIPLGGTPCVLTVAPPTPWGTELDIEQCVGFLLDGSSGVVLHELTWHNVDAPLVMPVYPPGLSCVFIHGDSTYADIESETYELTHIVDLEERFGANLQLEW